MEDIPKEEEKAPYEKGSIGSKGSQKILTMESQELLHRTNTVDVGTPQITTEPILPDDGLTMMTYHTLEAIIDTIKSNTTIQKEITECAKETDMDKQAKEDELIEGIIKDLKYPESEEEVTRAKALFSIVLDSEQIRLIKFPTMLISGFGLRNYPSLIRALQHQLELDNEYNKSKKRDEERALAITRRLYEIERRLEGEHYGEDSLTSQSSLTNMTTDVSVSTATTEGKDHKRRLEYLMGLLGADAEEEGVTSTTTLVTDKDDDAMACGEEKLEPLTGTSPAMRQAQEYLRNHHIFEFFQFIIVHLLSKVPANPIEFILLLLDKVLMYRSGLAQAPVCYKRKHLEQLFYLMDKMRTGFIDVQQYKTGMTTIGIKCFNNKPPLNSDGQVSKEFFIEEAYECSCHILNNVIRVRKSAKTPKKASFAIPSVAPKIDKGKFELKF